MNENLVTVPRSSTTTSGTQSEIARPNRLHWIFIGPNGIRAGWRMLLFLVFTLPLVVGLQKAAKLFPVLKAAVKNNLSGRAAVPLGFIVMEPSVLLPILFAAWLLSRIEHRPFGDYGLPLSNAFGKHFWQGVFWGLATETFTMSLIFMFHGFSFGGLALSPGEIAKYAVLWAIAFMLVALQEEFFYRGYLLFTLSSGIRFWPAAILTSLYFGAGHLSNPGESWIGGLEVAAWGLAVCFVLRRTGNLWFAVGFHAAGDFAQTFLFSVNDSGVGAQGQLLHSTFHGPAWLTGGTVGPEGSVLSFLTLLLFAILIHVLYPANPTQATARTPNV